MRLEIIPYKSVGPLTFEMTPEEVRQRLEGQHSGSFFKTRSSKYPTDAFFEGSVHVFYRDPGKVAAVEIFPPHEAIVGEVQIVGVGYEVIKKSIQALDPELEEDEAGFTSLALGVGAYAPHRIEYPEDPVESAIAFATGYYG